MTNDDLLREVQKIRELLELLAEPAVAQRDAALRDELRRIVGSSQKKQNAVLLMDGTLAQKDIVAQASINKGNLSTTVSQLEQAGLLADGKKLPKLIIPIPPNFFEFNE